MALPPVIPFETATGRYLLFSGEDLINDTLRRTGAWEPWVVDIAHALLTQLDPRPGVIIDAGANLGAISIALARRLPPGFTFQCFEIQRIVFYQLCGNILINGLENVHAYRCGLGVADETVAIPRPDYATDVNIGAVSASGTVRGLRNGTATDKPGAATESVGFRRLDSFGLDDVRLIKADVEGMELDILKGGVETLARNAYPPLLLEIWKPQQSEGLTAQTDALLAHLEGLGYGCQILGALCVAQARNRPSLKIHWDNTTRTASFTRREP